MANAQAATSKPIFFHHGRRHRPYAGGHLHRGWALGETPNTDRIGLRGRDVHSVLRHAELHVGAQCVYYPYVSVAYPNDSTAVSWQPNLLAPGNPDLAVFLTIWATRRASLARTIWATTPTHCRRHMVFRSTGDTCITSMPCSKSAFPTSTTAQRNRQSHRPVRTHLFQVFPRCRERWIQKRPFV